MTRSLACGALLLTLAGCGGKDGSGNFLLPVVDWARSLLPKAPDGNLVAIQLSSAVLELDPSVRDPLTGLGACTDHLTYCYEPGTAATLDACVDKVPRCATSSPWNEETCCPNACVNAYFKERKTREPVAAFEATFFADGTPCYPGVAELVGVTK